MNRANPTVLFGFFVALIVAICGASLAKGGFYLQKHEGDTLHMIQIVLRMADGEWPHKDFMTPIGIMAFWPFVLFVKLGFGMGHAILYGQTLMALVFLPAVWRVAGSRLHGALPYLFGVFVFVLIGALVHGEVERSVSISMHYNRWAWAAAFVAIIAAVLPADDDHQKPLLDGVIIGLAMAFLMLSKITYFGAFSPAILVALLMRRSYRMLAGALLSGLAVMAVITMFAGIGFWARYLANLLEVAGSEVRPNPSEEFSMVVGAPAYLGASMTVLLGVVFLRQARERVGGLVLLLLAPAFFYVTYQNFANDPQWLQLLAILLFAMLPAAEVVNGFGWNMRNLLKITGFVSLAFAAPSFFNLAYSPFRHLASDPEDYMALMPHQPQHDDIFALKSRAALVNMTKPYLADDPLLASYDKIAERKEPVEFEGQVFDECEVGPGLPAWFDIIASDLDKAGFAKDKSLFTADLLSSFWLYAPFRRLKHGAPWYYGGLPGLKEADYLLVPTCVIVPRIRRQILEEIGKQGLRFEEVRRTPFYILYAPARQG